MEVLRKQTNCSPVNVPYPGIERSALMDGTEIELSRRITLKGLFCADSSQRDCDGDRWRRGRGGKPSKNSRTNAPNIGFLKQFSANGQTAADRGSTHPLPCFKMWKWVPPKTELTQSPVSGRRDKVGRALPPRHHHHGRGGVHAESVAPQLLRALALAQVEHRVRHAVLIVVVVLEARL